MEIMEILWKILAPGLIFFKNSITDNIVNQYVHSQPNFVIRLLTILVVLSAAATLLFYLLGRVINLKHNWQWFTAFGATSVVYFSMIYNLINDYMWWDDISKATDIDWAFIVSPILWLFILFIAFSKLWKSIPNLTIFALHTPTFLSK